MRLNVKSWIATGTLLLFVIPCFAAEPIKRSFENYTLGDHLGKVPSGWEIVATDQYDPVDNEKAFFAPSTTPGVSYVTLKYIDAKLYWIMFEFTEKYVRRAGGPEAFVNKANTKYGKPALKVVRFVMWDDGRTSFVIRWNKKTFKGAYIDNVLQEKRDEREKVPVPDF